MPFVAGSAVFQLADDYAEAIEGPYSQLASAPTPELAPV